MLTQQIILWYLKVLVVVIYCSPLVIQCSLLVIYCSPLVIYCSPLVIYCSPLVIYCSPLVIYCSPLVIYCSPLVIYCVLLVICCNLLVICCNLLVICCSIRQQMIVIYLNITIFSQCYITSIGALWGFFSSRLDTLHNHSAIQKSKSSLHLPPACQETE